MVSVHAMESNTVSLRRVRQYRISFGGALTEHISVLPVATFVSLILTPLIWVPHYIDRIFGDDSDKYMHSCHIMNASYYGLFLARRRGRGRDGGVG